MLFAVLQDLSQVHGVEVESVANPETLIEIRAIRIPHVEVRPAREPAEEQFRFLASTADYALVIAPESDGILATRCRWVENAGGRLLGPSVESVELAADKLRLGRHLQRQRIATPACELLGESGRVPGYIGFPAVLKPRDGAGSQATFFIQRKEDVQRARTIARHEGFTGELLIQSFIPGRPVSVAFLLGAQQLIALPPASQELSDDGRLHYQGGQVPLTDPWARAAHELAKAAVRTVPGLHGFVGVDLVLDTEPFHSSGCVIEINPRLTTSYVGLRALARSNLMGALLRLAAGEKVEPLQWREGIVRFRPDGSIA